MQAALAAVAGWTLGSPMLGKGLYQRLRGYEPIPRQMAASDALDAWVVFASHLQREEPAHQVSKSLTKSWRPSADDGQHALASLALGFSSPVSGWLDNPLGYGPAAVTRALFWGLALHGDADSAAKYAFYDSSTDHHGEGVWIPAAIAAAVASTKPGDQITNIIRAIGAALPPESMLMKAVPTIVASHGNPEGPNEVRTRLATELGISDQDHAVLAACYALLGIVHSDQDPGKAMLVAAGCGGPAQHAAAVAGCLATLASGSIAGEWLEPLGKKFVSAHSLRKLDPPSSLLDFVGLIGDREPWEAALPVSQATFRLLTNHDTCSQSVGKVDVQFQYLTSPVASTIHVAQAVVRVTNTGQDVRDIPLSLACPEGDELATKASDTRLNAGSSVDFPAVYKWSGTSKPGLTLSIGKKEVAVPWRKPQQWAVAAPFANVEGTGYDKVYQAEIVQEHGHRFSGRSEAGLSWTPQEFPGTLFSVESLFLNGPGVAYLCAEVTLPRPGAYRLMTSYAGGCKVWVDKTLVLSYNDTAEIVPRPAGRNNGTFVTEGTSRVLVKVTRGLLPCPDLVMCFWDSDGEIVLPQASTDLG